MGKFLQVFGRGDCGLYRLLGESYFLRACYVVVGASEEVLFLQGGNVFEGHDKPQTEVCARWCPRFALGKRAVPGPARVPACMATSKLGNSGRPDECFAACEDTYVANAALEEAKRNLLKMDFNLK